MPDRDALREALAEALREPEVRAMVSGGGVNSAAKIILRHPAVLAALDARSDEDHRAGLNEARHAALDRSGPAEGLRQVQVYDGDGEVVLDVGVVSLDDANALTLFLGEVTDMDVYNDEMPKWDRRAATPTASPTARTCGCGNSNATLLAMDRAASPTAGGLDVERLYRAMCALDTDDPGAFDIVAISEPDTRPVAANLAAYYAALQSEATATGERE